jgi:hypothetical protein
MSDHYAPPQSAVADVNRSSAAGITDTMLDAMRGTKPWVLLIGIVLIVSAGFMLLGTLGMMAVSAIDAPGMGAQKGAMVGVGAMYAVMSVVYIMMGVYLFKYSSAIGRLLQSTSVGDMEAALMSQRKFWKVAGVITAVMIVLAVIGIVAAIAIPMVAMNL